MIEKRREGGEWPISPICQQNSYGNVAHIILRNPSLFSGFLNEYSGSEVCNTSCEVLVCLGYSYVLQVMNIMSRSLEGFSLPYMKEMAKIPDLDSYKEVFAKWESHLCAIYHKPFKDLFHQTHINNLVNLNHNRCFYKMLFKRLQRQMGVVVQPPTLIKVPQDLKHTIVKDKIEVTANNDPQDGKHAETPNPTNFELHFMDCLDTLCRWFVDAQDALQKIDMILPPASPQANGPVPDPTATPPVLVIPPDTKPPSGSPPL